MWQIEELNTQTAVSEWSDYETTLDVVNAWGKFECKENHTYDLHKYIPFRDEWVWVGQLEK